MRKENLENMKCHPEQSEGSFNCNCHSEVITEESLKMYEDSSHAFRMTSVYQSGRSMVEMLGVLAIIGVLTIIGITGFRYALNKHYANQTVERLMRRAVVLAGQANFGQNPSLHEFDENDGEYPISRTLKSTSESFTMRVDNVPQEVCQQIVGMEWKLAKIIPENCSDETMEFMFLNDLTDCTECQPETFPCEDYGTECGKCSPVKGYTRNDDDCTDGNKRYCVMGKCEPCPAGQIVYNNICTSCASLDNVNTENCHQCVDESGKHTHFYMPGWSSTRCFKCSSTNGYSGNGGGAWTTLAECNLCENRCFIDNGRCIEPGKIYSNSDYTGYALDPNGDGHCKCAEGYYFSKDDKDHPTLCRTCEQMVNGVWTSAEVCHQCKDSNGKHTHFYTTASGHERCWNCEDTGHSATYTTTLEECNLCENRCFRQDQNRCGIPGVNHSHLNMIGYVRDDATGLCVPES